MPGGAFGIPAPCQVTPAILVPIKQDADFLHLARIVLYTQLPGYCSVRTKADAARHYSAWSRRGCPDFEERVSFDGREFIDARCLATAAQSNRRLPNAYLKTATSTDWSQTQCARLYVRDNLFDLDRPLDEGCAGFAKMLAQTPAVWKAKGK